MYLHVFPSPFQLMEGVSQLRLEVFLLQTSLLQSGVTCHTPRPLPVLEGTDQLLLCLYEDSITVTNHSVRHCLTYLEYPRSFLLVVLMLPPERLDLSLGVLEARLQLPCPVLLCHQLFLRPCQCLREFRLLGTEKALPLQEATLLGTVFLPVLGELVLGLQQLCLQGLQGLVLCSTAQVDVLKQP